MPAFSSMTKPCEICGTMFLVQPCLSRRKKYCSRHCHGIANGLRFQRNRLKRLELIRQGADLPLPRRPPLRNYDPRDQRPDPDEPTPEEQVEINKEIQKLHDERVARCEHLGPSSHNKKKFRHG